MTAYTIIGGGSLGLLLAGRLAEAGYDVVVVTRTAEQAELLSINGVTIEEGTMEGQGALTVPVRAVAMGDAAAETGGPVLLAVKQTALTDTFLADLASIIPIGGIAALFQNGVGHPERLAEALPGRMLLQAVTTEGALRVCPATVRHTGKGDIRIGEWGLSHDEASGLDGVNSREDALTMRNLLIRSLKDAGFNAILSNKLEEAVWRKLLINAVINPLTALLRVRNGELTATQDRLALMRALFDETHEILRAQGLTEHSEAMWLAVLAVCDKTKGNESSMLQDVKAGRETEIDAINGAIGRMAAGQGRQAPWNESVAALVKATYYFKGD
ncbi:2-dehydropantoate 2-reductase [Cohnella sp. GCM10027633]|uniref:2-dehydropantoate 2-reductase n=1 Tax=unclassified Cohnella TaxID=2636738 RepID=UPI00362C442F